MNSVRKEGLDSGYLDSYEPSPNLRDCSWSNGFHSELVATATVVAALYTGLDFALNYECRVPIQQSA